MLAVEAGERSRGERPSQDFYVTTMRPLFDLLDAIRDGGYLKDCDSTWWSPSYSHGGFACRCRHHAGHTGRCVCSCRSWINRPKDES